MRYAPAVITRQTSAIYYKEITTRITSAPLGVRDNSYPITFLSNIFPSFTCTHQYQFTDSRL